MRRHRAQLRDRLPAVSAWGLAQKTGLSRLVQGIVFQCQPRRRPPWYVRNAKPQANTPM